MHPNHPLDALLSNLAAALRPDAPPAAWCEHHARLEATVRTMVRLGALADADADAYLQHADELLRSELQPPPALQGHATVTALLESYGDWREEADEVEGVEASDLEEDEVEAWLRSLPTATLQRIGLRAELIAQEREDAAVSRARRAHVHA